MIPSLDSTMSALRTYDYHPLADIFPLMVGEEFDALVDDIQENGLLVPIIILDGKILDGRNRHRACIAAGVEPRFTDFGGTEAEALSYVLSLNLNRRHLSTTQRAALAVDLLPHEAKLAAARRVEAATQGQSFAGARGRARDEAGRRVRVSGETVRQAAKIAEVAPDVLAAMRNGTASSMLEAKRLAKVDPEIRAAVTERMRGAGERVTVALKAVRPPPVPEPTPQPGTEDPTGDDSQVGPTDLCAGWQTRLLDGLLDRSIVTTADVLRRALRCLKVAVARQQRSRKPDLVAMQIRDGCAVLIAQDENQGRLAMAPIHGHVGSKMGSGDSVFWLGRGFLKETVKGLEKKDAVAFTPTTPGGIVAHTRKGTFWAASHQNEHPVYIDAPMLEAPSAFQFGAGPLSEALRLAAAFAATAKGSKEHLQGVRLWDGYLQATDMQTALVQIRIPDACQHDLTMHWEHAERAATFLALEAEGVVQISLIERKVGETSGRQIGLQLPSGARLWVNVWHHPFPKGTTPPMDTPSKAEWVVDTHAFEGALRHLKASSKAGRRSKGEKGVEFIHPQGSDNLVLRHGGHQVELELLVERSPAPIMAKGVTLDMELLNQALRLQAGECCIGFNWGKTNGWCRFTGQVTGLEYQILLFWMNE